MRCYRNCNIALAAAAFLSVGILNANAQNAYSTGFEAPTFSLGGLSGQNGWTGVAAPATVNVENTLFHSGTQAVEFTPDSSGGQNLFHKGLSINLNASPGQIVDLSEFAYITSGTSPNWDILAISGNGGLLAQIVVTNLNAELGVISTSFGSVPVAVNTWNEYDLVLDYSADTATAYINGTEIGSGAFSSASTTLNGLGIGQNSLPGAADLYVDDISVTVNTPEPGSIALAMAIGITGVGLRRRRTRPH